MKRWQEFLTALWRGPIVALLPVAYYAVQDIRGDESPEEIILNAVELVILILIARAGIEGTIDKLRGDREGTPQHAARHADDLSELHRERMRRAAREAKE